MRRSFNNYDDVREMLDAALANNNQGIAQCESNGKAHVLRKRMNQFRILDRDANKEIYPPDHPQHGRSVYDRLTFSLAANSKTVVIRPYDLGVVKFVPGTTQTEEESQP